MSNRIEDLVPEVAEKCRQFMAAAEAAGYKICLVHTLRTWEEQERIYAKGRTIPGEACNHRGTLRAVGTCPEHPLGATVTKGRGGSSWHNFGRAFDVAFLDARGMPTWRVAEKKWAELAVFAEAAGLQWGGKFPVPDSGHFQDRAGLTLAAAREQELAKRLNLA